MSPSQIKRAIRGQQETLHVQERFVAGSLAGATAQTIIYPMEVRRSPEPEEGSKTVGTPATFLVVQGSRLHTANAGGVGSTPGQGTKIDMPWGVDRRLKK